MCSHIGRDSAIFCIWNKRIMTRSVTIVNTSNWDGENYLIKCRFTPLDQEPKAWEETTLRPGESFRYIPDAQELIIEPVDSKPPEPFYVNEKQVLPFLVSGIGGSETYGRIINGDRSSSNSN